MAELITTFLPISIYEGGDTFEVFAEIRFDGGDYEQGGLAAVWDYTTALRSDAYANLVNTAFRKVSLVHATRPPISWSVFCGDPALTIALVPQTTSALPLVIVLTSSTGAEFTDDTALAAGMQGTAPVVPHLVRLRYKNEL